ncbi:MAG: tetratricopeptide repeat protein [Phycisphaerales bacterium JB040]
MNRSDHAARPVTLAVATLLSVVLSVLPGCIRRPTPPSDERAASQPEPIRVVTARPDRATAAERAAAAVIRGDQALERGDLSLALIEFERAIATNPELSTAYLKSGGIYEQRGELEQAASRYARAAELDPLSYEAHTRHGRILQQLERHEDAVRAFLRALAVRPDDAIINRELASAYLAIDRPDQAESYALRAVRLNPNSGEARINLAACYVELGRYDDAVVEYQQAAELVPVPGEQLLLNLADTLGRVQRYAEMAATLDQLVRTNPSAIAHERLGSALFRLKRYDDSLEAFLTATELDPAHYPAFNGVAVSMLNRYLWSSKEDKDALVAAVDALRTSLRLEPEQPRILELLRRYGPQAVSG